MVWLVWMSQMSGLRCMWRKGIILTRLHSTLSPWCWAQVSFEINRNPSKERLTRRKQIIEGRWKIQGVRWRGTEWRDGESRIALCAGTGGGGGEEMLQGELCFHRMNWLEPHPRGQKITIATVRVCITNIRANANLWPLQWEWAQKGWSGKGTTF